MKARLTCWFVGFFPTSMFIPLFVFGSASPQTRDHDKGGLLAMSIILAVVWGIAVWKLLSFFEVGKEWTYVRPPRKEELRGHIQAGFQIAKRRGLKELPEGYQQYLEEYERDYGPWLHY